MGFLGIGGPYMWKPRRLPGAGQLNRATYQVVQCEHGIPMVQLELDFPWNDIVSHPDMTLAVLLDRSGSMAGTFRDGDAYVACAAIFNHLPPGVGYDLVFYNSEPSFAGHISDLEGLSRAIDANPPQGGTRVTGALRGAIERYRKKRGIYMIVITDGEFADKNLAEQYIVQDLLPQITPDNPFAFRLHFVGAGGEVDREFLERLEATAAGQGVPLVTHHHHEHLSHSHASILEQLDRLFLGVGTDVVVSTSRESEVVRIGDVSTRRWSVGACAELGFLPRIASIGIEYAPEHGPELPLRVHYDGRDLDLSVPMPRRATGAPSDRWAWLKIPGLKSPQEKQAQADLKRLSETVRTDEVRRQGLDMVALAKGGIPTQAEARLKEAASGEGLFTSNVSPDEMALLRRHGYRALGLVTGSAVYHVGTAYASSVTDCEVKVLSDAYNHATRLAVSRLEQEARLLGAHGVVAVRLEMVRHEWADKTVEVQLVGTAVAGPGRAPETPWLCDLSAQEWWALKRAGYEPCAIVWGHCTWFVLTTQDDEWMRLNWNNQEIVHRSQALSQARHIALDQVKRQTTEAQGHGVVGVTMERRIEEVMLSGNSAAADREHHNLVISVIGTAIRAQAEAPKPVRATIPMLSLRDGRIRPTALHHSDVQLFD